jgi:[acyl-carrier-protein] S-malonyltransferase
VLAIVAPGQGAQKPGFLSGRLADEAFAVRANWLSAVSGLDLAGYGSTADEATIKDTAIAQPLLVAAGLCAARTLFPNGVGADLAAGHSVGEITVAALAGVLSPEQAIVFARERGRRMAAAAAARPTGMSAVLGGDPAEVVAHLESAGLTGANYNGKGQIVAAGTLEQLAGLAADPPAKTRVIPLQVAGAFHTEHMAPAVPYLTDLAQGIDAADPRCVLLSNLDGAQVDNGGAYLQRMITQVARPVRWDLCLETMARLGVSGVLELPPAGTLTAIAKRNLPGVELFALNTPDQLDAARDFAAKHGGAR